MFRVCDLGFLRKQSLQALQSGSWSGENRDPETPKIKVTFFYGLGGFPRGLPRPPEGSPRPPEGSRETSTIKIVFLLWPRGASRGSPRGFPRASQGPPEASRAPPPPRPSKKCFFIFGVSQEPSGGPQSHQKHVTLIFGVSWELPRAPKSLKFIQLVPKGFKFWIDRRKASSQLRVTPVKLSCGQT